MADDLLRKIVGGSLERGDLLPRETELAEAYGVNKSVIREGVKLLEVHGLVRPIKRRGTEVLDARASLSPEVLVAMLTPQPGMVDRDTLEEVLEIRAHLDVLMCGLAASRRDAADIEALTGALRAISEAGADAEVLSERLRQLVLVIAAATHNRIFGMLVHWHLRIQASLGELMLAGRQHSGPHVQGLTLLVGLIIAGDADGASRIVNTFHQWATPRILAAADLRSGAPLESIAS